MTDTEIIEKALAILQSRLKKPKAYFSSPNDVKNYLTLKFGALEHEVFSVMFLDNAHGLIEFQEMFRGTINKAAVYPREVLKASIAFNATAVIVAHNHPSGGIEPSASDFNITEQLKKILAFADIRMVDHLIVGGNDVYSFAENGYV